MRFERKVEVRVRVKRGCFNTVGNPLDIVARVFQTRDEQPEANIFDGGKEF